ncbi:uncharacterized protein DEA37_0008902 [Paragonimus westermani]|uniref:Reverse transcriptase domain-containing protein n=1 Tax=Paragonimus westermani TaxID=34504 RepID=A0A5J4NAU6_9TREM|nr:uncharacterized protein DEA37_0008902 [Paragonimus westermani]
MLLAVVELGRLDETREQGAFDSIHSDTLRNRLSGTEVPENYVDTLKAAYCQTSGWLKAYGNVSLSFSISSGVRQDCPTSPFLVNVAVDEILECTPTNYEYDGVDLLPVCIRLRDMGVISVVVMTLEAPFCCTMIPQLHKVSEFTEKRSALQRVIFYAM